MLFLYLKLIPIEASEEEDVKERTVKLSGNKQQVEAAKYMIKDVINQVLINLHTIFFLIESDLQIDISSGL